MVLHLIDGRPVEVWARGEAYLQPGVEDVVFGYVKFETGQIGHLHLSWLDPHKMRKMTVVGSNARWRSSTTWSPSARSPCTTRAPVMHPQRPVSHPHGRHLRSPTISRAEPLRIECSHFLEAVRPGRRPRAGVDEGLAVVEVLEAMQTSLERGGETIVLESVSA